jgi:hypothetical protein
MFGVFTKFVLSQQGGFKRHAPKSSGYFGSNDYTAIFVHPVSIGSRAEAILSLAIVIIDELNCHIPMFTISTLHLLPFPPLASCF